MVECVPQHADAAVEKHKPEVVIDGDKIITVNHVMKMIIILNGFHFYSRKKRKSCHLNPDVAKQHFAMFLVLKFAYCNKHGLWMTEVKYLY